MSRTNETMRTISAYDEAPRPVYKAEQAEPEDTVAMHNKRTKAGLDFLSNHPEVESWALSNAFKGINADLDERIHELAAQLSDALFENYGVRVCLKVMTVWVCVQLGSCVKSMTERAAGIAYAEGDSKANIARAAGIRQQNLMTHFPRLEEISTTEGDRP